MPKLVVQSRPGYPMVIPVIMHQCQVHPLQVHQSDSISGVLTMPYLLIRWVMLPITGVQVEVSILTRDLVPHGAFEGVVVNKRHSEYWRGW